MEWIEVKLEADESLRESVSNRLFEIGAEGVHETGEGKTYRMNAFFKGELKEMVTKEISSYLDSLAALFPNLPKVKFELAQVKNENWGEKYKEFYKAQKLTNNFFLKPAWDTTTPIPPDLRPIIMEPGQAFGTGLHASTRLSLRIIEHSVRLYLFREKIRFLDVGTGTGILAIAARKLRVRDVTATDNDPVAVEAAAANFKINDCADIKLSAQPLSEIQGLFDIIVSNILLETHREMAPHYRRLLKNGGQLILSGLLGYQNKELDEFLLPLGFIPQTSRNFQDWAAYSYTWRLE